MWLCYIELLLKMQNIILLYSAYVVSVSNAYHCCKISFSWKKILDFSQVHILFWDDGDYLFFLNWVYSMTDLPVLGIELEEKDDNRKEKGTQKLIYKN